MPETNVIHVQASEIIVKMICLCCEAFYLCNIFTVTIMFGRSLINIFGIGIHILKPEYPGWN